MSICPEKYVHSLYLDNELSPEEKAKYEQHIQECPKCAAELEKLKSLRRLLKSNTGQKKIDFNDSEIQNSYNKLREKMSYSNNSKHKSKIVIDITKFKDYGKWAAFGAAFALVLVIALPVKYNNHRRPPEPRDFEPMRRPAPEQQYNFNGYNNPEFDDRNGPRFDRNQMPNDKDRNGPDFNNQNNSGNNRNNTQSENNQNIDNNKNNGPSFDNSQMNKNGDSVETKEPSLNQYDVFEVPQSDKKGTVHFTLSSPIMNFTIEIDK